MAFPRIFGLMGNQIFRLALLAFGLSVAVVACKKDDDEEIIIGSTMTGGGASKTWRIDELTDSLSSFLDTSDCRLDDRWTFTSANQYTIAEGATQCDPFDPDPLQEGLYGISSDQSTLKLFFPAGGTGEAFFFKVVEVSDNRIRFEVLVDDGGPGTGVFLTLVGV